MKSKPIHMAKSPGSKLAPLGQVLKGLQLGQHITVEYPEDAAPTFALAINHYRKFFKLGFYYTEMAPGIFDVWLNTLTNEPICRLSPLGHQLKVLQFGQRITVDYPDDRRPIFPVKMAYYRKYLDKGFMYELIQPGQYQVWLGTRKQAVEAHRGLRHEQTCLEEGELQAIKHCVLIAQDWFTVCLLAMRCGIPTSQGRKLLWKSVNWKRRGIEVWMRSAIYPIFRDIPQDLCEHLEQLASASCADDEPICPVLAVQEKKQYHNEWSKVRTLLKLNKSRSLTALTWSWKEANPDTRNQEIALNHITALENKWLTLPELEVVRKLATLPTLIKTQVENSVQPAGDSAK